MTPHPTDLNLSYDNLNAPYENTIMNVTCIMSSSVTTTPHPSSDVPITDATDGFVVVSAAGAVDDTAVGDGVAIYYTT